MGHVVRLFRVGAIPNGDPSSRVPYIVILCNYMKTLQEKHLQGALDYDVLTHGCT